MEGETVCVCEKKRVGGERMRGKKEKKRERIKLEQYTVLKSIIVV